MNSGYQANTWQNLSVIVEDALSTVAFYVGDKNRLFTVSAEEKRSYLSLSKDFLRSLMLFPGTLKTGGAKNIVEFNNEIFRAAIYTKQVVESGMAQELAGDKNRRNGGGLQGLFPELSESSGEGFVRVERIEGKTKQQNYDAVKVLLSLSKSYVKGSATKI